ncbi:MAG: ATP-dependent Clp protease proteolytic subunit [Dehalococcoidia bacterium]|nr:ATP-dependent Clp protease proteolytic subunit [Dehalococcoidia bacterium]
MAATEQRQPRNQVLADGTIMLYGVIGDEWDGLSAAQIVSEIRGLGEVDELKVLINSLGGYVAEGLAIYHELAHHKSPVVVEVTGVAASMASVIAMAGSTIRMAKNGHWMIHDPWNVAVGNAEEMRRAAELLDRFGTSLVDIYVTRSGIDEATIREMMAKDNGEGTWLTADEAKELGFIDEVIAPVEASAFADLDVSAVAAVPPVLTRLIREGKHMARTADTKPKPTPAATAEPEEPQPQNDPVPAPAPQARATDAEIDARVTARLAEERARAEEIRGIAARCGLSEAWAAKQIATTSTVDAVRAAALDEVVNRQSRGGPSPIPPGAVVDADERDKWVQGAAEWVLVKAGHARLIESHTKRRPEPGEFRGFSLLDLARESLHRTGTSTRGMSSREIARAAIRAEGNTRSDFPVLLENVLHKILQAAYDTAPDQWRAFCATGSVQDFRPHPRLRLGSLARLSQKLESGEFRQTHFPDAEKEAIQAGTYGNIVGLTREAIVNDDVDGFTRLTAMLGRAAARGIEIDVFALLALNTGHGPVMSDSKTLFHADHNNLETSVTGDPSVAGLEACRILMAQQKDPDGNDYLNLRPHVWVGPIGLGSAARVAVQAEFDFAAETTGTYGQFQKPNAVRDIVKLFVDTPRLTGDPWYLFADPAIAPVIEVVFLQGQESPEIRTEEGFDYDGVRWRIVHDYGVGATDFRGAVRNDGD